MKKIIFVVLLVALSMSVYSQNSVVFDKVITSATHYANSATLTSTEFSTVTNGKEDLIFTAPAVLWDSIAVVHRASSDSVKADVYYKLSYDGTNYESAVAIDSIVAGAGGVKKLQSSIFSTAKTIEIYVVFRAAGNAVITANQYTTIFARFFVKQSPVANY
jgi:hypothetical protein